MVELSAIVDVRDAFCLHPVPGGAVAALRGLTLTVAAGERVVVHGPNGSGKTTLLRLLAGEQRLAAGRATVAGLDVSHAAPRLLAAWRNRRLGWIDQYPARTLRPELDVLDNVALQQRLAGLGARQARAAAAAELDRLGIGDLARRAPRTLSGGQAQRVAVCAALAHGPELVLADEPSGELDSASAVEVYQTLATAVRAAGAALVLVSHDRQAAMIADRVVRIRDGRIGETWRPDPDAPANGPQDELLVVDDRGWLRLPEALRASVQVTGVVRAQAGAGGIVLRAPAAGSPAAGSPASPRGGGPPDRRPTGTDYLVELESVTKAYDGVPVLHGVDHRVAPGRLLVIRGRSGSGKSTLLRIMVGLERPDSGAVRLDGVDLAGLDRAGLAAARRRVAAVVGQDIHLAETMDVDTNLELALVMRATHRGGAAPAGSPPDLAVALGLTSLGRRQGGMLSGGERQRVAVARALGCDPRLLVLDEPSSQLDEAGAESVAGVLAAAARRGAAVVVASHDPVLIEAADDVVDLDERDVG